MKSPVSVANKELTGLLSRLEATLMKTGGRGALLLTRVPKKDFCPACPDLVGEGASRPRDLSLFPPHLDVQMRSLHPGRNCGTFRPSDVQTFLSAILIAASGRRNESLSHPPSQGAPCSRCDSIPSSTRTLTSLPTGGNIRPTRATSTPTSSPAAVCLTKPCSPCCSTSSNPISPARSSPSTTSRRPAASHTPISAATQNPLTTKDSNLFTPSTVGACLSASAPSRK